MSQYILSENAVKMIEAMRENKDNCKASLCDAFADTVFNAVSGDQRQGCWRILTALQEYTHLIDCLTSSDSEINNNNQ